jgi:two-component system, sensor histidine kinase and response regulator
VAFRDITKRQHAVDALRRAKEAAEAANRAKSEFLANISHEVLTPLTDLMAPLDLLRDSGLTPEQREYVTFMQSSAERLLTLLTAILDFATIEAGERPLRCGSFPLRQLLQPHLQPFVQQAHDKGLQLTWHIAPSSRICSWATPTACAASSRSWWERHQIHGAW